MDPLLISLLYSLIFVNLPFVLIFLCGPAHFLRLSYQFAAWHYLFGASSRFMTDFCFVFLFSLSFRHLEKGIYRSSLLRLDASNFCIINIFCFILHCKIYCAISYEVLELQYQSLDENESSINQIRCFPSLFFIPSFLPLPVLIPHFAFCL